MKNKTGIESPEASCNWQWMMVFAVVIGLVLAAAIYPASDPDLYIMLATGRYVVHTGQAPTVDLWSHTAYGQPWQMHEWFSSLVFFGLFTLWGINGIILCKAFLLAAAFGLALYTMKLKGVSPHIAFITAILALLASSYGFGERIQIFSFFFLVLLIFWLELNRAGRIKYSLFLSGLLGLMILWANVHMTYMFGLFIIGLYLFDEIIFAFRKKAWGLIKKPGFSFASAFAVTGLNPYGFGNIWMTLSYYFRPELQKADTQITATILEYQPLLSPGFSREPLVIYGLIWIVFSFIGVLLGWKRLKFSFIVLWILFTYWAIGYVRFLWLQVFITLIGVGWHWQGAWDTILLNFKIQNAKCKKYGNVAFIGLIVAVLIGAALYQRTGKHLWQRFGLGWKPRIYTDKGVDFLRANMDGGKLFNDFDIGGYLLWKQIPVFVDGRIGPYFGTSIIQDHHLIYQGNLELIHKYGIDWIILAYGKTSQTGTFDRLNRLITDSGQWALVFWDDACMIYVRRTPKYAGVIEKYQYRFVNPATPDFDSQPRVFLGELTRKLDEEPMSLMPHTLAGNFFFYHNDVQTAEREFKLVLEKDPYNAMIYNNLGNVYLRQGKIDQAIAAYKKAVKYDVNLGLTYCNWGYVMEARGDTKEAVRLYTIATKVTPSDAWPYNRLGIIEMKSGNRQKAFYYWRIGESLDKNSEAAISLREYLKNGP
ncbi:MAG: tetratricopeptide repeat protein [Candidatus Edwardsbacteria bacterium]|nr:tetratricopeptide repeat protein [Candidatus Edwardsbacteria bacterium]